MTDRRTVTRAALTQVVGERVERRRSARAQQESEDEDEETAAENEEEEEEAVQSAIGVKGIGGSYRSRTRKCHICLRRLHTCVNQWLVQALCLVMTLVHSAGYYMDWERLSIDGKWRCVALIWGSFLPLVCISLFEVLVRVSAQGGPFCLLSSWLRFFSVVLHQVEALFVIGLCYRLGRSTYLVVELSKSNGVELTGEGLSADRATVPTLIGYRLVRAYGIFFGITVQAIRENRERRNRARAVWMQDHQVRLLADRARPSVCLQEKMNSKYFQIAMIMVVLLHCGLYGSSRSLSYMAKYYYLSKFTGYSVCAVFALEFFVRAMAQGGLEAFFLPKLQKIEAIFALLGIGFTAYSSYYHFAIVESRAELEPSGLVTAMALIVQRALRCLGIYMGISGSELCADSIMASQTIKLFRQKFADILHIPEQNLLFQLGSGNVTVRVQKAEIRASAFEHLHLPITVRGGLVEDLYVMINHEPQKRSSMDSLRKRRRQKRRGPMTRVSVKNLLVLLGPGDGLAEAGGVEPMGRYWNHDTLRTAKAKLVELIHVHLTAPSGQQEDPDHGGRPQTHEEGPSANSRSAVGFTAGLKTKAKVIIKNACLRHVEVDIRRAALQYDDVEGRLGCGAVSLGVRLGNATVSYESGKHVHSKMLRLGLFVRHHRRHSDKEASDGEEPLWALLQQHPELAKQELEKLDRIDTFRTWAFEELQRRMPVFDSLRHRRMETWRDQHEVFALTKLEFAGAPLDLLADSQSSCSGESMEGIAIEDLASSLQAGIFPRGPMDKEEAEVMPWNWSVELTPVRTAIDELQARCVKTIVAFSQAWLLHDNAFKWWPYLSLADVMAAADDVELARAQRSYIVRFWWIYAIHRVLAMKRLKPRVPWMELLWRVRRYRRYKVIVTNIAKRTSVQAQMPLVDCAQGWERVLLEELQVQLPLWDVVNCRKTALAIMQKHRKFRRGTSRAKVVEGVRCTVRATLSHVSAADIGKTKAKIAEGVRQTPPSFSADGGKTKDPSSFRARKPVDYPRKAKKPAWLSFVAGSWEVCMPVVEVRVLRAKERREEARGMLLYAAANGIFLDAHAALDQQERKICGAALTVDFMRLRSLEADPLLLGGSHNLCTVLRPLRLPAPIWEGTPAGRRAGCDVVFASRGLFTSDNSSSWEVHLPDLRLIVYEPLLLLLASYAKLEPVPLAGWMEPAGLESSQDACQSKGNHSQRLPDCKSQKLTVYSSASGQTQSNIEVDATELSAITSVRADMAGDAHGTRRFAENLRKVRRSFELNAGVVGLTGNLDVRVNVGAVHCSQVCEYSRTHLLVEQCRCRPYNSHARRGPREENEESASRRPVDIIKWSLANRRVALHVNHFREGSLTPWNDERWNLPYEQQAKVTRISLSKGPSPAEPLDGLERLRPPFEVGVFIVPCKAFNEEWQVKESLNWHSVVREEVEPLHPEKTILRATQGFCQAGPEDRPTALSCATAVAI